MKIPSFWFALALTSSLCACGSDDSGGGGGGGDCPTPSADPSFETEVLPLTRRACGLSGSCHGAQTGSQADLYLGPAMKEDPPDAAARTAIIAAMVGQPSMTAPTMNLVTASDPSQSFLMHKMDDTHRDLGLTCNELVSGLDHPCGDSMPQGGEILCKGERDLVRNWIQQGAKDN